MPLKDLVEKELENFEPEGATTPGDKVEEGGNSDKTGGATDPGGEKNKGLSKEEKKNLDDLSYGTSDEDPGGEYDQETGDDEYDDEDPEDDGDETEDDLNGQPRHKNASGRIKDLVDKKKILEDQNQALQARLDAIEARLGSGVGDSKNRSADQTQDNETAIEKELKRYGLDKELTAPDPNDYKDNPDPEAFLNDYAAYKGQVESRRLFKKFIETQVDQNSKKAKEEAIARQNKERAEQFDRDVKKMWEAGEEKYADFKEVARSVDKMITPPIALITSSLRNSHDVLYFLAKKPTVLEKLRQIKTYSDLHSEMHYLSGRLSVNGKRRPSSKIPVPRSRKSTKSQNRPMTVKEATIAALKEAGM